jgi:hypothetical protein
VVTASGVLSAIAVMAIKTVRAMGSVRILRANMRFILPQADVA